MSMSPNVSKEWLGELNWKTLFPDSESEGSYPVLTTSDGQEYRVRLKDAPPDAELGLRHLDGLQVRLEGYADDLRGHWRINVAWLGESLTLQQVVATQSSGNSLLDETSLNSSSSKDL
jgi:hypothetical protein